MNSIVIILCAAAVLLFVAIILGAVCAHIEKDEKSRQIVKYIKSHESCTLNDIASELGLPKRSVKLRLGGLVQLVPGKHLKDYMREKKDGILTIRKKTEEDYEFEFPNLPFSDKIARLLSKQNFHSTHTYIASKYFLGGYDGLHIDEKNKQFAIIKSDASVRILPYSALSGFEIYQNGNKKAQRSAGGMLVGGLLFGAIGAAAGTALSKTEKEVITSLEVHIKVNALPALEIFRMIKSSTNNDTKEYTDALMCAKEISAALEYILNSIDRSENIAENQ